MYVKISKKDCLFVGISNSLANGCCITSCSNGHCIKGGMEWLCSNAATFELSSVLVLLGPLALLHWIIGRTLVI